MMKQLFDDLWQTPVVQPFPGLNTHAYVLRCSEGTVLIYSTTALDELERVCTDGLRYQYLSHRDEVSPALKQIKARFGCQLCCSEDEAPLVTPACEPDVLFSQRQQHFGGIEVLPTPGHTAGSISFLYPSPSGGTYLFTGDALVRDGEAWRTLIFPGSGGSEEAAAETLQLYRTLRPDVVIPSGSSTGTPAYYPLTAEQWTTSIDASIERLGVSRE